MCLTGTTPATDVRRITISGEPLEDLLARTYRPAVSAAIVRPEPFPEAEAWVIEEAVAGPVGVGSRLELSRCSPVLRIGSTPEHIRSLITDSPVVEAQVESPRALVLPLGKGIADFAPPRRTDRFLLLFEPRQEGAWAFAVQTVGDIYLLRGERVFRTAWVYEGPTITSDIIWAPVGETSATALVARVRAGLKEAVRAGNRGSLQNEPNLWRHLGTAGMPARRARRRRAGACTSPRTR